MNANGKLLRTIHLQKGQQQQAKCLCQLLRLHIPMKLFIVFLSAHRLLSFFYRLWKVFCFEGKKTYGQFLPNPPKIQFVVLAFDLTENCGHRYQSSNKSNEKKRNKQTNKTESECNALFLGCAITYGMLMGPLTFFSYVFSSSLEFRIRFYLE